MMGLILNLNVLYNICMPSSTPPLVVGVAGGSGSGKTTLVDVILERVGSNRIAYLPHDAYYRDLSKLPPVQKAEVNFDHPNSLETELLIKHIQALKEGCSVDLPIYDFAHHARTEKTTRVNPRHVIIVEGILILAEPKLRELLEIKIFVDTDPDLRFIRRLQRDIAERGRSMDNVIHQYVTTVRPMHLEFVEQSKRYADVIVPEGGFNSVALDMVISRIEAFLQVKDST
jgi:uridine kinase